MKPKIVSYSLQEVKILANNKPIGIRPINADSSCCPYLFKVVDGKLIDAKGRQENEQHWIYHQFIIQNP